MRLPAKLAATLLFLAGPPRWLRRFAPDHLAGAAGAIMLLGVAWGLLSIGLWELTYPLSYQTSLNWVLPACACAAATCLLAYRQGCLALARMLPLRRWWVTWPVVLAVAAWWAFLLNHAVRWWDPDWPRQLPPALSWLWPRALHRVLLLAPVWGSWATIVLGRFHRPTQATDPHTCALAEATSPLTCAVWLAVPLAGSFVYLLFLPQALRFVPPAAAIAAALGGGTLIVRLRGRLCRQALLATNVLTQTAFLLAYALVR